MDGWQKRMTTDSQTKYLSNYSQIIRMLRPESEGGRRKSRLVWELATYSRWAAVHCLDFVCLFVCFINGAFSVPERCSI